MGCLKTNISEFKKKVLNKRRQLLAIPHCIGCSQLLETFLSWCCNTIFIFIKIIIVLICMVFVACLARMTEAWINKGTWTTPHPNCKLSTRPNSLTPVWANPTTCARPRIWVWDVSGGPVRWALKCLSSVITIAAYYRLTHLLAEPPLFSPSVMIHGHGGMDLSPRLSSRTTAKRWVFGILLSLPFHGHLWRFLYGMIDHLVNW